MMKVLFSNPPWWDGLGFKWKCVPLFRAGVRAGSRWPFTFLTTAAPFFASPLDYRPFPFFMSYAAGYLEGERNVSVEMRDSIGRRESYGQYYSYLKRNDFDYIVFEVGSPSADHDFEVIKRVAKIQPKAKIVVTGPVVAEKSEWILRNLPVVACVKGEYEKGICEVINGADGVIEHMLMTEKEMNEAPLPKFDHDCGANYIDVNPRGYKRPQGQIWTNRGCPYKCIFCVWPAVMTNNDSLGDRPRKVRYYSPEYISRLVQKGIREYGWRSLYIDDDTFNLGDKHTRAVCEVLKGFGLPWSAMCRADTISLDTWALMKESGCYGVKVGVESGSQEVIDNIVNKRLNLKKVETVVRHIAQLGMSVHGTFTLGLPGETPEQMRKTLEFSEKLPFTTVQVSGVAEIEGTPLWNIVKKGGSLENYRDAKRDNNYISAYDGAKKADEVVKKIK